MVSFRVRRAIGCVFVAAVVVGPAAGAQESLNGTYSGTCAVSSSKGGSDKSPRIRFTVKGGTVENASYVDYKGGGGSVKNGVAEFSMTNEKSHVRVFTLDLAKGSGTIRGLTTANTQSGECRFSKTK